MSQWKPKRRPPAKPTRKAVAAAIAAQAPTTATHRCKCGGDSTPYCAELGGPSKLRHCDACGLVFMPGVAAVRRKKPVRREWNEPVADIAAKIDGLSDGMTQAEMDEIVWGKK